MGGDWCIVCPLCRILYCAYLLVHLTTPHSSVTYSWCMAIVFSVVMIGRKKVFTSFVILPVQLGVRQGNVFSKWFQQYLMTISQSAKELHVHRFLSFLVGFSFRNMTFVTS